jgi:hypothetical protein
MDPSKTVSIDDIVSKCLQEFKKMMEELFSKYATRH